jgi:hypothetical protein
MISSNNPSKLAILTEETACEHYGTSFNYIAAPGKDQYLIDGFAKYAWRI